MAAASLFWDTNTAALTSCEKALSVYCVVGVFYGGTMKIACPLNFGKLS